MSSRPRWGIRQTQYSRRNAVTTVRSLRSRLANVISLQALRNFDCEGSRELMCFVFYDTAVQLVGQNDASRQLCSFNSRFTQPLSQASTIVLFARSIEL